MADEREILRLNPVQLGLLRPRPGCVRRLLRRGRRVRVGDSGGRNCGREELRQGIINAKNSTWLMGHVTADGLIDIDDATQKVFVLLYRRESADGPNEFFASGRYSDRLRRTAEGWRFVHRTSYIDRSDLPWTRYAVGGH